jgi:hypothetical protein
MCNCGKTCFKSNMCRERATFRPDRPFCKQVATAVAGAPLPSAAAPGPGGHGGETIVATFDLVGQGLSPLSDKDAKALIATVNRTLAAHSATITNITLGQVKVGVAFGRGLATQGLLAHSWCHLAPASALMPCPHGPRLRDRFMLCATRPQRDGAVEVERGRGLQSHHCIVPFHC